jgi:cation diffusion facilitator CzcD-associated flavoprotein CzcO
MTTQKQDVVVVGAGFAGLYMLHRLRELGLSVRLYEAGGSAGGTWFWNRYPGARCDIESLQYSYSFSEELQREWKWSERYASQPEILRYLNHVADRFDLRRDIQLETRVTAARFDESTNRWAIHTDRGDAVSAEFCVMATGCLSIPKAPEYKGLQTFQGSWYQTARWPEEKIDFTGKHVGVIGTGSSGIQCIPMIARQAEHLFVFQRTPNFSMPARNQPLAQDHVTNWEQNLTQLRQQARVSPFGILIEQGLKSALEAGPEERQAEYENRWEKGGLCIYGAYADIFLNKESNDTAAHFVHSRNRSRSRDCREAPAKRLSARNQASLCRYRVLRDVQSQ